MGESARVLPTFDELYAEIGRLAEHLTGEILEPGVVRTMSRPGARHQFASRRITRSLAGKDLLDGGHGWWFEIEREVRLEDRLMVPDIAGWRAAEMPTFVDENPITVVPDWCCEILSPSTAREDRLVKLPLYARLGVEWIWLVDVRAHSVEVFEARQQVPALVRTARDSESVSLPPFETTFDVGSFWKESAASAPEER